MRRPTTAESFLRRWNAGMRGIDNHRNVSKGGCSEYACRRAHMSRRYGNRDPQVEPQALGRYARGVGLGIECRPLGGFQSWSIWPGLAGALSMAPGRGHADVSG